MMVSDRRPTQAGTWIAMDDDSRLTCRVDGEDCAELVISGPVEIALGMSEAKVRECMSVLGDALDRMNEVAEREARSRRR